MRIAFTIGAYRLTPFIRLGVLQLKKLSPDSPILVSDDRADESGEIEKLCEETDCTYRCTRLRKGHFASDFQALINSLVFAEGAGCDVAVKISQRFVLRKPEAISVIQECFANPNIMAATPGQPRLNNGTKAGHGFGAFTTLSDIVMLRVGSISAEQLLHLYRSRLLRESVPWASFLECTVDELHSNVFSGRTRKLEEFTNPTKDPIYLRRYQATERQYRDLALSHGFNGNFPLIEWNQLEQQKYFCRPLVV